MHTVTTRSHLQEHHGTHLAHTWFTISEIGRCRRTNRECRATREDESEALLHPGPAQALLTISTNQILGSASNMAQRLTSHSINLALTNGSEQLGDSFDETIDDGT